MSRTLERPSPNTTRVRTQVEMHRPRSWILKVLCLALLLPATGCGGTIVDRWPRVDVQGVVRDHTGAPVASASVRGEVRALGCADSDATRRFATHADSQGRFHDSYDEPRELSRACVIVEVSPAGSAAFPPASYTLDSLYATRRGHDFELDLTLVLPAP